MKITVRYFASIRELVGVGQESLNTSSKTLTDLRQELVSRGGPYAQALGEDMVVRMALNQKVCDGDAVMDEGAEIAFFPPVTGG
jgi:molybdopterin synthase sulfur carrier subunit